MITPAPQQYVDMSMRSTSFFNSAISSHQLTCPIGQTCAMILFARKKEEDIARQRSPISKEMFASLIEVAKHSPLESLEVNVADWIIFIRITGLRCAEYAQKNQSAVDVHIYPSGKRVVKAFLPTDWEFYDDTGAIIGSHRISPKN